MLRNSLMAALAAALTLALAACHTDQADENTDDLLLDNCSNATKYSVQLCIDDNQSVYWTGLWDECFNLGTQTSWTPEQGIIQIRSTWQLCKSGFKWTSVQHLCGVPTYKWTVEPELNYWVGTISFPPNECLAEAIPNCYTMTIYGQGCPY